MTGETNTTKSTPELDAETLKDFLSARDEGDAGSQSDELSDDNNDEDFDDDFEEGDEDDEDANEDDDGDDGDDEDEDEEETDEADDSDEAGEKKNGEGAETGAGDDNGAGEKKPQPSAETAEPSLEEELKTGIKPDFIPGSKEFFQATAEEAKAQIVKELGEFDEYNPEHIARFNYFVAEAQANRKAEYQDAVEIIKQAREQRVAQRRAVETQEQIDKQIDSILNTPELKQRFASLLKSMETNSRGDYLVLVEQLNQGKPEGLITLAKRVAGPHGRLLEKKPGKTRRQKPEKSRRTNKDENVMTAADLGLI
jgi:hypothetical protein